MSDITTLRCDCGSSEIASIKPGNDPVRSDIPLFDVLLDAGAPTVAFCRACLMRRYPKLNRETANG